MQDNIESSSPINTTRLAAGFSFGVFMLRKTDDKCGPQRIAFNGQYLFCVRAFCDEIERTGLNF